MNRFLHIIIVLFLFTPVLQAQTDTIFWFAPPDLEINHQQTPIRFCFTTYEEPATVTFSQPANGSFTPVTFTIAAESFYIYDVSSMVDIMETKPINTVISRGVNITSTAPISCYYESVGNNSEIYTLKGQNALGTDFLVPMQTSWNNNYSSSTSSIQIIATEDSTVVQINAPVALHGGIAADSIVTITLQRGQSYAIRSASTSASAHLHNTVIHSNKPIAVNTTDDSVYAPGGCYDLIGDQLVPKTMLGNQYVAVRNNSSFERIYVFPTENNTTVSINGVNQSVINIGQWINYELPSSTLVYLVESNHPVAVFQVTAIGCELGGTMLPQIECTGSHKVAHLRPNTSSAIITIVTNSDYVSNFLFNGNANVITASNFSPVPGDPSLSYCRKDVSNNLSTGSVMTLQNPAGRFQLGALDGTPSGNCSYGFFSDYAQSSYVRFTMDSVFCEGSDIQFEYSVNNLDNVVLTCPNGQQLTEAPFIFTNVDSTFEGMYKIDGVDTTSCLNIFADSIYIRIANVSVSNQDIYATACSSYVWNDVTYSESGNHIQNFQNVSGCDSIVTLHLTLNQPDMISLTASACDQYVLFGDTITQSGEYTHTLTNANGCDSVVTYTVTVHPSVETYSTMSLVQNQLPYYFAPADTTFGLNSPAVTQFQYTLPNQWQCDSVIHQTVLVYSNVSISVDTTVCFQNLPFTWHGHSFTAAGSYAQTLQTSHGADSVVTYNLSVDHPVATIGDITHITCYGESTGAVTATVTGGVTPYTYAWTNTEGASVSTTTAVNNRPAGTYTFTTTDHLGCTASATVTLNTLNGELQAGSIAGDQELCMGSTLETFTGSTASGGDNGAYQWQISYNGTDWATAPGNTNTQNYSYPSPLAGAFSLRRAWVSQSCGTVYSNTVSISLINAHHDTIEAGVCIGEPYQGNGFNITAEEISEPGNYTFEANLTTSLCDSFVVLHLTVHPQYNEFFEEEICEGNGYTDHGFHIPRNETVGVDTIRRTQSLQSIHGCDSIVTLRLTVIDTALRIVSLTTDFCENQSAELMVVTEMPDYEWSTGEHTPTILATTAGLYSVTATDRICTKSAYHNVAGCHYDLYLPNAITPSDFNGVNDYFCLPEAYLRDISLFEIAIFNRWGEMIFYSTDKNFQWSGEYRSGIHYQTTYNYVILYTDTAGRPHRRTGSITVL